MPLQLFETNFHCVCLLHISIQMFFLYFLPLLYMYANANPSSMENVLIHYDGYMHQGKWNGFHSPRYRKILFLPWHLPNNFKNDNIWKSNGKIFLYKFKPLDDMKGNEIYSVEFKGKRSLQQKLKITNGYS